MQIEGNYYPARRIEVSGDKAPPLPKAFSHWKRGGAMLERFTKNYGTSPLIWISRPTTGFSIQKAKSTSPCVSGMSAISSPECTTSAAPRCLRVRSMNVLFSSSLISSPYPIITYKSARFIQECLFNFRPHRPLVFQRYKKKEFIF